MSCSAQSHAARRRLLQVLATSVILLAGVIGVRPDLRFEETFAVAREAQRSEIGPDGVLRTAPTDAASFASMGVALDEAPEGPVRVRWHDTNGWSEWTELTADRSEGPDPGTAEAVAAGDGFVTDPVWVGEADRYQIEVVGAAPGTAVEALVVRRQTERVQVEAVEVEADATLNRPGIRSRSSWGARPAASSPAIASTLRYAVVHHTASGNDYTADQVPSVLRSMQAYHMDAKGWSDIGYNFLVDRFGRVWEGRGGGIDEPVVGAHASGFNTGSVGVSVIGDYENGGVFTSAMTTAVADVISWKFANHGVDPTTEVDVVSAGGPRYASGTEVTLPRIVGHTDVGFTDCPGKAILAKFADIRRAVLAQYPARSTPAGVVDTVESPPGGAARISGWAADPNTTGPVEIAVSVDGAAWRSVTANVMRADLVDALPVLGGSHGFSIDLSSLPAGAHKVCLTIRNVGAGADTSLGCHPVGVWRGAPLGNLERVDRRNGVIGLGGWALDPDTHTPIEVEVTARRRPNGAVVLRRRFRADAIRSDLPTNLPGIRPEHGVAISVPDPKGDLEVCLTAIDQAGTGAAKVIGCRVPPVVK